jgi:hypothetical protein
VVGSSVFAAVDLPAEVTVKADTLQAVVSVAYARQTGSITLAASGLPGGVNPVLALAGPGGFDSTVTGSTTLRGLDPGTYTVSAQPVTYAGGVWQPTVMTPTIQLAPNDSVEVGVSYAIATGGLTVMVLGLPPGADASIRVTGPGGFESAVTGTTALVGLAPGDYSVIAATISSGGHSWKPAAASQLATVAAGTTPTAITISYVLATGAIALTITGLPDSLPAAVTITGPAGFNQAVTGPSTLTGLAPGSYSVAASPVGGTGQPWVAVPANQDISVTASLVPAPAAIAYAPGVGSLSVSITGLPGGSPAAVTISGPSGYHESLASSRTLTGLPPGGYTVAAGQVILAGQTWTPSPVTQAATITVGGSTSVVVQYNQTTGSLAVLMAGLPNGTAGALTVTGPGGYSHPLAASQTLAGLVPGSYTVTASTVTASGTTWVPAPPSQSVPVVVAATATATVTYAAAPASTLNLRIDGVYLTQATQRYDGTVPLVAGRDAYLRAFALASEANTAAPPVRIRLYSGGSLVQTYTVPAAGASVPLSVNEGSLAASWNVLIPGNLVQPNLRVLADVDPGNTVSEANESDNAFPLDGTPAAVDVRALPTFNVRFVPVLQQVNGRQGSVSDATREQYLADLKRMLPVAGYDADVRLPYTTTAPALQSDNANGAWGTILSEVLALRSADGNSRYYYGVVNTSYSSGVAGIGYVGGSARTALGWDRLPSGASVMAHELGHNMGRSHAPCGGVANPDPSFPYASGKIGVWGLDVAALSPKSPATYSDLMGYCSPEWISDYNWQAMLGYRQGGPNNTPAAVDARGGLLIWGRITPAGPVLEPAFFVDAPASLPGGGPHRLELTGAGGTTLMSVAFSASEVADTPTGPEQAFAFVLPVSGAVADQVRELRLTSGGRRVVRQSAVTAVDPATALARGSAGEAVIRWNAARYPMVLVRDGATGQLLSFARGGEVRLSSAVGSVSLTYSDGVRSRRENRTLR